MLSVEKFIEKLLLKHDCVIIPALGGFVTHYESAYQDSESGMYYPPSRSISFNSQLKMNDGLLVQAYMQAFDTNFPEANRMVEHEAERIKSVLRSTGVFLFQNLGILELKENDRLLFTPQDEGGIAAPDLYGLDAFFMKQYVMQQKVTPVKQVILSEKIESNEEIPADEKNNNIIWKSHYTINLNKNVTNYFAAALVAIVFYFSFAIPVSNDTTAEHNHLSIANGALYGFPIQSIIQPVSSKSINKAGQTATASSVSIQHRRDTSKNIEKKGFDDTSYTTSDKHVSASKNIIKDRLVTAAAKTTKPYYTIVLASSIKKENALIFVKQLKEMGYDNSQVHIKNKMVRVVYSKYTSEEDAHKALNHLRNNDAFNEAWILRIN